MDDEKLYWLAFSAFNGVGPKRFALLKNYFGSAKKAWEAGEKELLEIGLGPKLTSGLLEFRNDFDPSSYFLRLRENEIECYFLDDNNYPENLKKIDNPPFILYVKGTISPEDELAIAVVGTRKMTGYGGQVTESLVTELVGAKMTIVSGLARGVDSMAHKAALRADGRTIGVLACGLILFIRQKMFLWLRKLLMDMEPLFLNFLWGCSQCPGVFRLAIELFLVWL